MNFQHAYTSTIVKAFGETGARFLADLPALIDEASARWGLTNIQTVPNLSYNFVAFAESTFPFGRGARRRTELVEVDEGDVILKIGIPRDELTSEIAALRLFNGEGACKLIDFDEEKGFLLLERLQPGEMLSTLEDDEEATRIAAEAMKRMWRSLDHVTLSPEGAKGLDHVGGDPSLSLRMTSQSKFIQLADWFGGLKRLRKMFNGGTGPLNEKLVARVEQSTKEFFAEDHSPILMHGDLHHFNILSSGRGWLAIDPKGVIGPACYEVGPLMINPWGMSLQDSQLKLRMKRRVDVLCEHLGFERERIIEWSIAHAILSAWWGIEDQTGWEYSMRFANSLSSLK
ncbi:MAG TPA: aminoglycoside phosphotransferase family protein [Anaerolineales bacterium]|nr:aminoglycoside phosphotransferase family protein [Anaerolineales bacterium]